MGQPEPGPSGKAAGDHYANFTDYVRSRRAEDIHLPIEEAHISCTLVHLANASYRLGRTFRRGVVSGVIEETARLDESYTQIPLMHLASCQIGGSR